MSDAHFQPRRPSCKRKAPATRVQPARGAKQQRQQDGPSTASDASTAAGPASAASVISQLHLALSTRQPALIIHACDALAAVACSPDGCIALHQQQATIPALLLQCLSTDQPDAVAEHALRCLFDLGNAADAGKAIYSALLQQQESVRVVAECCVRDSSDAVSWAAQMLDLLVIEPEGQEAAAQQPSAVPALVTTLTTPQCPDVAAAAAAHVLSQLAATSKGKAAILQHAGAVDVLVSQLKRTPYAAYALQNLAEAADGATASSASDGGGAVSEDAVAAILQTDAVHCLVQLAADGTPELRSAAATAIAVLAWSAAGASAVLQQPASLKTFLTHIAASSNSPSPAVAAAVLWALTGHAASVPAIIGTPGAVHALVSGFTHSDDTVSLLLLRATHRLARTDAGAAAVLQDGDAVRQLAASLGRGGDIAEAARMLLQRMGVYDHAHVFAALLRAVSDLARDNAALARENAEKGSLQDATRNLQEAIVGAARHVAGARRRGKK